MQKPRILLFVKYPLRGFVKTRIGQDLGDRTAVKIYKKLANHLSQELRAIPALPTTVFYTPRGYKNATRRWLGQDFTYSLQQGSDLGERLRCAAKRMFKRYSSPLLILGVDTPGVNRSLLYQAVHLLKRYQAVIGPTFDGGYYLLGFNHFHPHLFEGIDWGSSRVFGQTLQRLKKIQYSRICLKKLCDMDTPRDLKELAKYGIDF